MGVKEIIAALISPITDIIKRKQERKIAKDAARAQLAQAQESNHHEVTLGDQQLEHILAEKGEGTWKDEYATVSVVSILNIFVVGGIQAAYGDSRTLEGIAIAINALAEAGVDVGFLLEAVVLAAVGLNVWRKF